MKRSNRFELTMLVVLTAATLAGVQVSPAGQESSEPASVIAQGACPAPVPRGQTDNMVTDAMVPPADDLGVEPAEMTIYPEQLVGNAPGEPGMSVLARAQVITPGALATTLLNEGFESTWPAGAWSVWFFSGNQSNATWGRTSYRKSSGSYSIWCAAGGSGAAAPGGSVPLNTSGGTIVGPLDLTNATSGSFAFDLWLQTELNVDQFKWLAESGCDPSVSACTFSGSQTSTNTTGFQRRTQDLANWGSAGSLLGKSNVWIALIYTSNGSNQYEGAYVDNVSLTFDSGGGSPCGTYVVSADNDNNSWAGSADGDWGYCLYNTDAKHPIEFHVDVTETSITTAQLLLLCNDVDEDTTPNKPEVDKVYVNDTYVGNLTGANDEDSTTLLTVPVSILHSGRNKVRIDVNTDSRSAPGDWCVTLKQAQLIVNGGCQGTATCRSVTTNKTSYDPGNTVVVTYEVDTSAAS